MFFTEVRRKNRRQLQCLATGADPCLQLSINCSAALEVQLRANLIPASIGDRAGCQAKIRVLRIADVVASEIVVIESVEHVESEPNRCR